jgi:hypothetical protein
VTHRLQVANPCLIELSTLCVPDTCSLPSFWVMCRDIFEWVIRSIFIFSFSFIRLADYMILHTLHMLSRNSLEDMVTTLCKHYHFLPSGKHLHTIETCKKLEDPRPPDAPQVSLP